MLNRPIAVLLFALSVTLATLAGEPAGAMALTSSQTTSSPSAASATVGDKISDTATVTGVGSSPTGPVTFSVCGPLPSPSGCATGGSLVGSADLTPDSTLTATATATSPTFAPPQSGTWCFRADYSGDSLYDVSSDSSAGECVTVLAAMSQTSSSPQSASVTLGDQNLDTATVTGAAGVGAPSGTVTFFACGPLSGATGCASGAGSQVGSPVSVSPTGGDGAAATSSGFVASAAGTWCFRAEYSGDAAYTGSSDGSATECFTVAPATPRVVSTPASQTIAPSGSDSDHVVITGNGTGGSPTGSVQFFACGPLSSPSGCPTGGTPLGGGSAVPLSAGANTATADSPAFAPPSPGTWCFRAVYSGNAKYRAASDSSSAGCFTMLRPGAPSATITSPRSNATYAVGQRVNANYSCAEGAKGPGIASCAGPVPQGSPIDTSTRGRHTFTVRATSKDGMSTPVSVTYAVAAPPSVVITSPRNGAVYTRGQAVGVAFSCTDDPFGPGLAGCSGPSSVATSRTGAFTFTVRGQSTDGMSNSATAHFRVVYPSNRFRMSRPQPGRRGRISFRLIPPGPGTINVLEIAHRNGSARGASFVYSRLHLTAASRRTLRVTVPPNSRGTTLLRHHRSGVPVIVAVTYTPSYGLPRTARFAVRVRP